MYKIKEDENIINKILNDYDSNNIINLMQILDSEKQDEICKNALINNDEDLIYMLAYSTNCQNTILLIDNILNMNTDIISNLISNLNGQYLLYVLNKIVNEKGAQFFSNIINTMRLYSLNNLDKTIDYIFANKLDSFLDLDSLNCLNDYKLIRTKKDV